MTDDDTSPGNPWVDRAREELAQLSDEVLYTEKTHLAAAERLGRVHTTLGVGAAVAAAGAAATLVADWSSLAAGALAVIASVLSALLTFLKPDRAAEQHLAAGRQLAQVRVALRQVTGLDLGRLDEASLRAEISRLSDIKATIDDGAPATRQRDYGRASRKIKSGVFDRDR